jgi:hypothetical protein
MLNIFDLSFNIGLSMNLSIPIKNSITYQNVHNLIFIQAIENILLLNILNFNIIGRIENPFNLMSIFNDKILFNCLYYNYNIKKNIINCMLCQEVHKIPNNIENDTKINDLRKRRSRVDLRDYCNKKYRLINSFNNTLMLLSSYSFLMN